MRSEGQRSHDSHARARFFVGVSATEVRCVVCSLHHGANPRATDVFLCTKDRDGAVQHIKMPKNWEDVTGHVESLAWVRPGPSPSGAEPIDLAGANSRNGCVSTIEAQD